MKNLRALFADRALRRLIAAQVPADFADWMDFVAIGALLAFHWRVEPIVFALLAVAFGLPYLVAGPIAGVLVDRFDVRRTLILSNLGRAAATLAMALAGSWPLLLGLIALRGIADSAFTPAKQNALQALTRPEVRTSANSLSYAINQMSKILAPSVGGGLLVVMDPAGIFLVNAAASLVAAAILWRLPLLPRAEAPAQRPAGMIAQLREGMGELGRKPLLRGTLALMATGYFAMFFYDTLLAPLTRDLRLTETGLGLCLAAIGAGGVTGALALSLRSDPRRPLVLIACGYGAGALLIGWLGLAEIQDRAPGLALTCALCGVIGAATSLSLIPIRTIVQDEVAPEYIGRVTALSEAANALAMLTAPFLGAALASAFSVGAAFVAGGALMAAAGGFALVLHRGQGPS